MPDTEEHQGWYPETNELPPRPRTRLLTPMTATLTLVLVTACGFVGGVLVQKGQATSAATVTGAGASRFGATGASGATGLGGGGRFAALFGGAAGSRGTVGTVSNINGSKLYVTTAAGTMVQVDMTSASKVTKSQSVGRGAIRPGDSVVISGITATNGTVTASSVSDSGAGSSGGTSSLFGGGTGAASTTTGGGTSSLFGG